MSQRSKNRKRKSRLGNVEKEVVEGGRWAKNGWKGVVESIQSVLDSVKFKDRIWFKVFLSIVCFLKIAYVLVCLKGSMCFKYSMVFKHTMDVKCSSYDETGISFCDRLHARYRSISSY